MNFSRTDLLIPEILLSTRLKPVRHILLQFSLLLITANIFWDTPDRFIFTTGRWIGWLLFYLTMNVILYVNLYLLVPKLLLKNRIGSYLIAICTLISGFILLNGIADSFTSSLDTLPLTPSRILLALLSSFLSIAFVVAGVNALLLLRYWITYTIRAQELESATLQSELTFLKNQINPHFLFNMLNNANVLIKRDGEEAARVLFKLEDLLRYQINDSSKEWVSLDSDIRFLNDFLNLEKIRRDQFEYQISNEGTISGSRVPPLLFIPFVENAVKHNTTDTSSYVHLTFRVEERKIYFTCENPKPTDALPKAVGGLGQKNIKRRLELLFPGRHKFETEETENRYIVKLILDL